MRRRDHSFHSLLNCCSEHLYGHLSRGSPIVKLWQYVAVHVQNICHFPTLIFLLTIYIQMTTLPGYAICKKYNSDLKFYHQLTRCTYHPSLSRHSDRKKLSTYRNDITTTLVFKSSNSKKIISYSFWCFRHYFI